MGLFDNFKKETRNLRISENIIYEQVADELNKGIKKEGLWLKAIENSNGLEHKVKPLYIKYRVSSIKDEIQYQDDVAENIRKKNLEINKIQRERKQDERFYNAKDKLKKYGCDIQKMHQGWIVITPHLEKERFYTWEELDNYIQLISKVDRV